MEGDSMNKEKYAKEIEELGELKEKVLESLRDAPEGRIRSELAKGKYPQYYYFENNKVNCKGRYLKKSDIKLARACAQKEYDNVMLKAIEKREKVLRSVIAKEENNLLMDAYNNLPSAKKCLINPYILSDEMFIKEWFDIKIIGENTIPMSSSYRTERGELVRSKSEKIIADKLFFRNVPYKYESGLKLNESSVIFPDFTILNINTREEVYFEHFGMMDNPEYCKKAIGKIEFYEKNDIHMGDKLFVSFESSLKPINLEQIDILISRMV